MKFIGVLVVIFTSKTLAVEITRFQPEIVPLQSITTLNIATARQLNASSTIQCRFNDMSMPAELKGALVFCNTPPMRQIDKAVLHLDVDGKLFKAKKQLRFHEPFKVSDISPKLAAPTQQLGIKISGITCEKWMTFFVRFQTSNGTKKTQKGICENSTVTCYIPEFPAHALLRVGVTLSNRIVEWSPTKLRIQYPIDSMKSSLKDLHPDIKRNGAFTFKVILKDKFHNSVRVAKESETDSSLLSVQYSPYIHPKEFSFINCDISIVTEKTGSTYGVSCDGAKHERILIYPSINNVPVGGTSSYEVKTTLCPGKTSCDDNTMLIIIVSSAAVGTVVLLLLAALYYKYRHSAYPDKFFVRSQARDPNETSLELNQYEMPYLSVVENLPASHVNESALSSDEEALKEADDLKDDIDGSQHLTELFPETAEREAVCNAMSLKKEESPEEENADGLEMCELKSSLFSSENVQGSHVNEVALSPEEDEKKDDKIKANSTEVLVINKDQEVEEVLTKDNRTGDFFELSKGEIVL